MGNVVQLKTSGASKTKLEFHPIADVFPLLAGAAFDAFAADVKENGLKELIVLYEGQILDGRNRYRACRKAGIPPRTIVYKAEGADQETRDKNALSHAISLNVLRRHLSESQRAICAARTAGLGKGRPALNSSIELFTQDEASKRFNVSVASIKRGRDVLENGTPELINAVDLDLIAVSAASKIAKCDEADQRRVVERVENDHVKAAFALQELTFAENKKKAAAEVRASKVVPLVRQQPAALFLKSFKAASVDLLLTDPPYMTDVPDIEAFAAEWLPLALKRIKPSGRAYVCIGAYPREVAAYIAVAATYGWLPEQILPWVYRNTIGPTPARDYKQNWQAVLYWRGPDAPPLDCPVMTEQFAVQDINAPDGRLGDRYHAWQKPDELAERFVRHSSKPGDLVIDPFTCTGTFLVAAAKLGRKAIGGDINPKNLKIAVERGCKREAP